MRRWIAAGGITALALIVTATTAQAERVPSSRVPSPPPSTGDRPNIFVPYTTNGTSTLGIAQGVAPRIYASPTVDDPKDPQAKPVFNLPFYGAVQGFGGLSNGAVPRAPGPPFSK